MRLAFPPRRFVTATIIAIQLFGGVALAQETDTAQPGDTPDAAAQPQEQNPLIEKGEAALEAGDFAAAMQAYEQLAQEAQQMPEPEGSENRGLAIVGHARVLAAMGEYEAALEGFDVAVNDYPSLSAFIGRGQLHLEMGQPDLALTDFETVVKAQRGNLAAQLGLGTCYVLLGQAEQGVKPLSRVIAADPQNAEAYRLRGAAYAGLYKIQQAISDLEQSISLNPDNYEAYFSLGIAQLRAEDYQASVDQLGKAIEHYKPKPNQEEQPYVQGYLTRASAFIELGKSLTDATAKNAAYQAAVDEANRLLEQLNEDNPNEALARAAALYGRGIGERMLGELGRAVQTFTEAIELNPDMGEAYLRRGICFHLIGEDTMAISDFKTSARINYDDPRASLWEGFTQAKLGEYHDAVRAYGDAIAASDRYTPAYVNRGLAYMMLGEPEKAVADFDEAIRLEPTKAEHYFKRGVAHRQLGDNEEASESFASAIEFDNKHAGAYRHMAEVMQALGRTELAAEYRQKANELAPEKAAQ